MNGTDAIERSLLSFASVLEPALGRDRVYGIFSAAFRASGGDRALQEALLRGAAPFFDPGRAAVWETEFSGFLGTPACAALVTLASREARAAAERPLELTGGSNAFQRKARLVAGAYEPAAEGARSRFQAARIAVLPLENDRLPSTAGATTSPYDGSRIDWRALWNSIDAVLGGVRGAGELFDRCIVSFCAARPGNPSGESFAKTMAEFRAGLVPGSADDLSLFLGLALSLESTRGLEAWETFSMLSRTWAKNGFGPREASLALADFQVDERYTREMLKSLLSLIETCAAMFHPGKTETFGRVFRLVKGFLRYARSADKGIVAKIFDAVVRHPSLDLSAWVDEGARVVRTAGAGSQAARQYFDRKSEHGRKVWSSLDSGVEFEDVRERFTYFVQALTGKPVALRTYRDEAPPVVDAGSGGGRGRTPAGESRLEHRFFTDGKAIWVPPHVNYVDDARRNLLMLRHGAAHESAHIEFGSFLQDPVRCSATAAVFERLFPGSGERNRKLLARYAKQVEAALAALGYRVKAAVNRGFADFPDQVRLGFLTPFPTLFRDVLNIVEDYRVNLLLYSKYPGYAKEKAEVDGIDFDSLRVLEDFEPETRTLQALIERLWFGKLKGELSDADSDALGQMMAPLDSFAPAAADIYHSAMVAGSVLRTYLDDLSRRFPRAFNALRESTDVLSVSFSSLDASGQGRNCPLQFEIESAGSGGAFVEGGGPANRDEAETRESFRRACGEHGGPEAAKLEGLAENRAIFRYDEWDHAELAYIRDKCLLVELDSGTDGSSADDSQAPDDLAKRERGRAASVRKAFQALKESLDLPRTGMDDGDDIDFDRCFDALLDFRAGGSMEDDFYIQRSRKVRDVACALALDMSPSTRRTIGERSVFAHEASAAFLLSEAMRSLDDRFGIYALFDMGARANVFHVIKDMEENPAEASVASKLSAFRPSDRGFSRIAPGLRHLVARKLGPVEARVKLLFFITDGMPFYVDRIVDKGETSTTFNEDGVTMVSETPIRVSRIEGPSEDYAYADLARAFEEALDAGIRMICITLDESTVDRLSKIFGNSLVYLNDVSALPSRLVELFRKITR